MDEQKPGPVEVSIASSLGVAGILAGVLAHKWLIGFILLGLLLLLVGGYLAWRWWKRRRNSQKFSGDMEQQGGNASVRTAEQKAQSDQLRKAWNEGINVYKSRKKDIYSVPWYLMIGTPGSGKTEAIRHSEMQFPPGLTDPLAGVGGTINMNWWFTNCGVILDTAGKMVFPEASGSGQSNEWNEFLKLLRKHRPACPINGLFLALDVDKMIKDSGDAIGKKASQVAQQLDRIQRSLDVRFPVYLLVTKSDFLTGFKEFFEGIDDPLLQNQILGWSNPGDLDEPINPDAIEQHLRELVEVIKRRRMAAMRAPVNLDLHQNRRLDCTDAMFAFPESLERLIPRLKRYLQIIFSTGEFSSKPVFLRGIYFTSSMQQNGDLDEALAEFMGIKVTELPPANVQETAKSYFLRDLFIEKAFPERLVTNASNTRRMRRNRLLILAGVTVLTLGVLMIFSWLGYRAYRDAVGQQLSIWQAASNSWERVSGVSGVVWHPIVVLTNNQWVYTGDEHPFLPALPNSLADFHAMLQGLVSRPSAVPWIFGPLQSVHELPVKEGQRVLVEHSVVLPLLEGARSKMADMKAQSAQGTEAAIRLRKALECLVQTQADIDAGPGPLSDLEAQQKLALFITPLLHFLVNTNFPGESNLVASCAWTYSSQGVGYKDWPPKILLRGTDLASDAPINNGLDCLIAQVRKNQQEVENHLSMLTDVCASLLALERAENTLRDDARNNCALTQGDFEAWQTAAKALQSSLGPASQQGMLEMTSSAGLLQAAVSKIELENSAASSAAYKKILEAAEAGSKAGKRPMFDEIKAKCNASAGSVQSKVEGALADYRRYIPNWDSNFLATSDNGRSYFEQRNDLYKSALALRNPNISVPVGTLPKALEDFRHGPETVGTQVARYNGPLKPQLELVCGCVIDESNKRGQDGLFSNYVNGAEAKLNDYYNNSTTVPFEDITVAHTFFTNLDSDLQGNLGPFWKERLQQLQRDAEASKKALIKGYTNWLMGQLSASAGGASADNLLQPYQNFRDRWNFYSTNQLNSSVVTYFPAEPVAQLHQWAETEAGKKLDEYAKSCTARFSQVAGFPVIVTSSKQMTLEDVSRLKEELKQRTSEFTEVSDRDSEQSQAYKTLKERVLLMSQIVAALAPDVKAGLAAHPEEDGKQNQCPYAHITFGDHYGQLDLTKPEKVVTLSDLAAPLQIKVTSRNNPDDSTATTYCTMNWPKWGALHLINLKDVRIEDGKWIVPLPVPSGNVYVELRLLELQLPSLDRWKSLTLAPP